MKLYTEEQVREVLSNMLLTTEQVESILKELSPQGELKQSPEHIKPGMLFVKGSDIEWASKELQDKVDDALLESAKKTIESFRQKKDI